MNFWEFILALGFWQWIGVIILVGIVAESLGGFIRVNINKNSKSKKEEN